MIKLRFDYRDLCFQEKYGLTTKFADEFYAKDSGFDFIQPAGDVRCTCITCADIARDETKVEYDIDDIFTNIPHGEYGADPREALRYTVKTGLLSKTTGERVKIFKSYRTAHTGLMSPFDNVRSAMTKTGLPVAMWSPWFSEWSWSTILMKGINHVSCHMYTIDGWKMMQGRPMLIIESWCGRKQFMTEEVFNDTVSRYGSSTAVLCTSEADDKIQRDIISEMLDGLKNVLLIMQEILFLKKK